MTTTTKSPTTTTKSPATSGADRIEISRVPSETMLVPIVGTSPLIVHRFSEKARKQMLDAAQGNKPPREPKDPEAEYRAAFHRLKDGKPGFPATGFKAATVSAGRFFSGVTMTGLRQFLFFKGEIGADGVPLVRIEGEPRMREDVVTVNRGGSDLRYRPEFSEWSAVLEIVFVSSMITQGSVLSLVDGAGLGVGIGDWRPEKGGDFGTFRVDPTKDITVLSAS
jgi:hypothetical protein